MVAPSRPVLARSLPKSTFPYHFQRLKTTLYCDVTTRSAHNTSHAIRTLAWSPLGNFVATGAGDRTLRVWNPEKPSVRYSTELRGHTGAVEKVAWHPLKEAELASIGSEGVVRLWDVRSKDPMVGEVKIGSDGLTLVWSPDGEELLVGTKDDELHRISRSTLSILSSQKQHSQTNQNIFSWSGNEVFVTTGEGQVKILDYPSLDPLHTINAHTSSIFSIELSPPGTYLAIGGSDALISLWDTTDMICKRTLPSCVGPVKSVSFSFDGSYIVGGSDEGNTIDIAHTETGEYVHSFDTQGGNQCVAWHPRSYVLAYSCESPLGFRVVG
ncbi:WD40 repeat-like protein [Eremomyces bilateralis CBS 781.70]|uniref:WD40 repeat-like protein n=1 Tax=Eremomyces bilateralis CBS 781.70 TaxID=1392243 RepID=A0A6G1GGU2_9PEZI|nr:WD40 repeat-like protein [Eremomyces bilateralis CBS 781.70]KAF1817089.1 WD40 repeat-like protein [Eremomyces bilateralis CBS 781.70]